MYWNGKSSRGSKVFRSIDVKRGCSFLIKPLFLLYRKRTRIHFTQFGRLTVVKRPRIYVPHFPNTFIDMREIERKLHRRNINQLAFDGKWQRISEFSLLSCSFFTRVNSKEIWRRLEEKLSIVKNFSTDIPPLFDYTNKFS